MILIKHRANKIKDLKNSIKIMELKLILDLKEKVISSPRSVCKR